MEHACMCRFKSRIFFRIRRLLSDLMASLPQYGYTIPIQQLNSRQHTIWVESFVFHLKAINTPPMTSNWLLSISKAYSIWYIVTVVAMTVFVFCIQMKCFSHYLLLDNDSPSISSVILFQFFGICVMFHFSFVRRIGQLITNSTVIQRRCCIWHNAQHFVFTPTFSLIFIHIRIGWRTLMYLPPSQILPM